MYTYRYYETKIHNNCIYNNFITVCYDGISGNFDSNRNIINNENPSNNYVRIGNITFMNNFTYQIME